MSAFEPWTIGRVVSWASDDLRKRGNPSPLLEVQLMLGHVLQLTRVELIVDATRPLKDEELGLYRSMHQRRRKGEPIAYLLGKREFYGREFRVDSRVLIPRPETEFLVEVGLARTQARSLSCRVLDLCTGSGCVAITIAKERPTNCVLGIDISSDAISLAKQNALRLGAVQVGFRVSDLFRELPKTQFDLITANPPYVSNGDMHDLAVDIREYEPHLALKGGIDGLDIVRRIMADAQQFLANQGVLAMEIGSGQAESVAKELSQLGYTEILVTKDYAGHERIVSAMYCRK